MKDQAASLRELKANYDKIIAKQQTESINDFLTNIKRDSISSAYILMYQENIPAKYPEIGLWLPKISKNPDNLYLWDQAELINNKILTEQEAVSLPFTVLSQQQEMLDLKTKTDFERFEFLKNITSTLEKYSEVWITINSNEIPNYKYLLNSANAICLMLPDCDESVIKGYETVKKITKNEINTPVTLLEFSSKPFPSEVFTATKIKNVAKHFLGIDLSNVGVVLSSCRYISLDNEGNISQLKPFEKLSDGGFMYSFSENIVNLPLGTM
jgi:hypothetical protein